jgi:hypothetical protein
MSRWLLFLSFLVSVGLACGDTPPEKTKEKPELSKIVVPEPSSKPNLVDHAHESPHGGMVATSGDKHLELKLGADGHIDVFVLDKEARPMSSKNTQGKVTLTLEDGIKEFPLTYDAQSDHLTAMSSAFVVKRLVALVDLTIEGRPYSARFDYQF